MWIVARAVPGGVDQVKKQHANNHIPISSTAAGLMLFENVD